MDTIKERKMQHSSWHALIKEQLPEGYFGKINHFIEQVYAQGTKSRYGAAFSHLQMLYTSLYRLFKAQ